MIGVVQDFHFSTLREEIGPIALTIRPHQFYVLGVRVKTEGLEETLAFFEKTWKRFAPADQPFEYMMWDQRFEDLYSAEQRAQALTLLSSGMAILLACMGLFGLAAFTVEQRVKEIGVRKVLGASVSNIVMLISQTLQLWFWLRICLHGRLRILRCEVGWKALPIARIFRGGYLFEWCGRLGDCVVYSELPRPPRGCVQSGGSPAA